MTDDATRRWDEWRRARSKWLADLLWPVLQEAGEANKAWLLVEIGSLGGDLAIELSHRMAWRDLMAFEEDAALIGRGDGAAARDPALHRLEFCRARLGGAEPALPVWSGYASGALALGALSRTEHPAVLVDEVLRIVRPGGALIVAEPVGGFFSGIPRDLVRPAALLDELARHDGLTVAHRFARRGFGFVVATKDAAPPAAEPGAKTLAAPPGTSDEPAS